MAGVGVRWSGGAAGRDRRRGERAAVRTGRGRRGCRDGGPLGRKRGCRWGVRLLEAVGTAAGRTGEAGGRGGGIAGRVWGDRGRRRVAGGREAGRAVRPDGSSPEGRRDRRQGAGAPPVAAERKTRPDGSLQERRRDHQRAAREWPTAPDRDAERACHPQRPRNHRQGAGAPPVAARRRDRPDGVLPERLRDRQQATREWPTGPDKNAERTARPDGHPPEGQRGSRQPAPVPSVAAGTRAGRSHRSAAEVPWAGGRAARPPGGSAGATQAEHPRSGRPGQWA